jgi:hypothetical protein
VLTLAAFLCFVVVPTCAVAAALVRGLNAAAVRAEREERLVDLNSNAAEIAMRIESLESLMLPERQRAGSEVAR